MKKILAYTLFYLIRFSLWFRYSVTIKGLENINPEILNKPGGVLFLPNHPTVFVDPTLVALAIWKKYPVRPIIVEYMYYTPIINWLMRFMNAIPVPNFVNTSNSLKKKKGEKVFDTMIEDLKKGDDFLIYPGGRTKHQARELINGSGVHRIVQAVPDVNIVLVRTTGLWGSSFSRALTGTTPFIFTTIFQGMWIALKNLLFFTPRRKVTIEFQPAGPDFPYHGTRVEFNRYLEKWYNRPDGIIPTKEEEPGESLYLVPYSIWSKKLPEIDNKKKSEEVIDIQKIPEEIQEKIKTKLGEISQISPDKIKPEMNLGADLGLDSLDSAELLSFLDDSFDVAGVPVSELSTVGKLMAIADHQLSFESEEEIQKDLSKWNQSARKKEKALLSSGETIHEVFLNNCDRMGSAVACGDIRSGISTYAQAKMRVIILAEYIRKLPGEYIGIMLPSSVAAYFTILACQLAGKIPLMVNWTVGPRHLDTVVALSKVEVVLSSWAFLDRLENVDLNGVDDRILMLEDVRRSFNLIDKMKALYRSKLSTSSILKIFNVSEKSKNDQAVLLFTSGTESMPKGVPLTHGNILSNQRAAIQLIDIYTDDILLGILPPFHAFGFTISGLLALLSGVRVAYYPDPTDGPGLVKSLERWKANIICGTPAFLLGIFKNAKPGQLDFLRLCVTGAEKAPADLFEVVRKLKNCSVIEGYGITECSPILTVNQIGPNKGVGQPIPGVEMTVIDLETHQVIPKGKTGMILTKGPNIFNGYLNKGLASPFIFLNGVQWYSTGDLGYLDDFGNLHISGRLKRFVKIGGEMISLGGIEEALIHYLGSRVKSLQEEGAVLAISALEEPGERPKLFLFTRFPMSVEEANRALRESGFSNLVRIYQTEEIVEIPLMGTGKVNYRALEARLPKLNSNKEISKGL